MQSLADQLSPLASSFALPPPCADGGVIEAIRIVRRGRRYGVRLRFRNGASATHPVLWSTLEQACEAADRFEASGLAAWKKLLR